MLVFPNCKINLGLHIVSKRKDGYHNIETAFYPVNWCDALEVLEQDKPQNPFIYSGAGNTIDGKIQDNLVYKAWLLLKQHHALPPLKVVLQKNIPMGAGLGGGSADAAFFLKSVNELAGLNLPQKKLLGMASALGSDCSFFIRNKPLLAKQRGDKFSSLKIDLSSYYLLIVYPGIHSNTREAYAGVVPRRPKHSLKEILEEEKISEWKKYLVNDFESSVFKKYPAIEKLKQQLYANGALYAAMSGSGSAVYGIFKSEPRIKFPPHYRYCLQKPVSNIL